MKIELKGEPIELDNSLLLDPEAKVRREINSYLAGNLTKFTISYKTPNNYTGKVMSALSEIPYGETKTYGDIANKIDSSAIAVGQACGRNPLPLVVPCHRVVKSNGLGGYLGKSEGSEIKKMLLDLESSNI